MKNIEFQSYKGEKGFFHMDRGNRFTNLDLESFASNVDMPHSYCLEELRDLQSWIVNRFPVSSSSRL